MEITACYRADTPLEIHSDRLDLCENVEMAFCNMNKVFVKICFNFVSCVSTYLCTVGSLSKRNHRQLYAEMQMTRLALQLDIVLNMLLFSPAPIEHHTANAGATLVGEPTRSELRLGDCRTALLSV